MTGQASILRVLGIDPGSTVGIFDARWVVIDNGGGLPWVQLHRAQAAQAVDAFELDDEVMPRLCSVAQPGEVRILAVERFVIARGSMRGGAHARRTSERAGSIAAAGERHGWTVVQRNAAQVKAWATDGRLDKAGLLDLCRGMRHARDAARHTLFAAVHDGGVPDPLSKHWNEETNR